MRRRLEDGHPVNDLFNNKLAVTAGQVSVVLGTKSITKLLSCCLSLINRMSTLADPFEYYMFIFAHKMTDSTTKVR